MSTEREQCIAAMRSEIAQQKLEWNKARDVLARLGDDVRFQVPEALMQVFERTQRHGATPLGGVRA